MSESPVLIRPGRFGLTVIAERPIRWGEEISRFLDCEILDAPTSRTLQLSPFEHAYEPMVLALVDHGCDPNTFVDVARRALIANQDIPAGAPLTRFYPSTEWVVVEPFKCLCGQPNCVGEVRGSKFLEAEQLFSRYVSCPIRELYHSLDEHAGPAQARVLKTGPREQLRRPALFQARESRLRLIRPEEHGLGIEASEKRKKLLWD